MAEIDSREEKMIAHMRLFRAKSWRSVRSYIFGLSKEKRLQIYEQWNKGVYPMDPCYLWAVVQKLGFVTPEQIREIIELSYRES
jgi:hypothetical protein